MSSYLLLRNNKESGPFTIEEIQGMSLKAYDLIWVVGKSAAWRYPGEIADLKSFAPAVPEQLTDRYFKKPEVKKAEPLNSKPADPLRSKSAEQTSRVRENNGQKINSGRTIYVNLPTDKKAIPKNRDRVMFEPDSPPLEPQDPTYDFSDLYKKRSSGTSRFTSKILWVSTFVLLFGTGILTGFFISDRRIFFSKAEKTTQKQEAVPTSVLQENSKISAERTTGKHVDAEPIASSFKDSSRLSNLSKLKDSQEKKRNKIKNEKKDTALNITVTPPVIPLKDSVKQSILPRTDLIYQQIVAHPENYISLQPGRYSTGVFGGISSFPITLTNNSTLVLNLAVTVDYIQNNEKIFKTESLSFSDLQPGESATLKAPKSSRGVKIATHLHVLPHQSDPSSSN